MAEHTSKQFDAELERVRSRVLQMGGLVEEQITRAMINPFAAMLTINDEDPGVTLTGVLDPLDDVPQMIRFDIIFDADRHMVLENGIRIRDHRDILHEEGLAAPAGEIVVWAPAMFVPPPPPP